ncbi:MAG: phosphate/phosphite/phosphonate ABC transporter substrate-binding protein [Aquificaceae bacterium]|nr:phosphate/phosphite/phosphonate ABC transporter substrate-binding protein [Aquificaceae bacterium]
MLLVFLSIDLALSETIRFAPLPGAYREELIRAYSPLLKLLEKKTGFTFEMYHYRSYEELFEKFMKGEIDLITMCTLTYYQLKEKYQHAKAIASFNRDPKGASYSCILFSAVDGPHRLKDMVGPIALPQKMSTCGYFSASIILSEKNISLEKLGYRFLPTHEDVVKAVLAREYGAGMVSRKVFEKYKGFGLRPLGESPRWPSLPLVANTKTLPPEVIRKIEEALFSLTPEEQKKLAEGRYGFSKVSDEDFNIVEKYKRHIPK